MYAPTGVKTSPDMPVPDTMKAWVLGDPHELKLTDKPVPVPKRAEVLVRIDAVAICATDLEIIYHGPPASIQGGFAFNKNFTPGHEYMGTVVALGLGVDEYKIGQRVTVEIHAGCGQCKRCREGMYTACHNYGLNYGDVDKGHRANGFTTDGGFCEYQVNNINTLVAIPDAMSDEEATLVVTAGTAMYGLTELGGLVAGESVVVIGPGPIGLLAVAVAKALGASPVILTGNAQPPPRHRQGARGGPRHQYRRRERGPRRQGAHRRDRRRLCGRVRRHRSHRQPGHSYGQSRRENLPRRISARPGDDGSRSSREKQHLCLRHSRRRSQRHATRDGADGGKAVRRDKDSHAYLCACRPAHGAPIRPRAVEDAIKVVVTTRQTSALASAAAE